MLSSSLCKIRSHSFNEDIFKPIDLNLKKEDKTEEQNCNPKALKAKEDFLKEEEPIELKLRRKLGQVRMPDFSRDLVN